jgi:hypothetical protein
MAETGEPAAARAELADLTGTWLTVPARQPLPISPSLAASRGSRWQAAVRADRFITIMPG